MINPPELQIPDSSESYITSSVVQCLHCHSHTRGDGGISDGWATVELEEKGEPTVSGTSRVRGRLHWEPRNISALSVSVALISPH